MSQRKHKKTNRDSDDGMSTAGKVVLGVAVAAAGAAIGYLGSRLLDGWLSNSEEEKGAAAAPVSTPSKPKVVDDSDDESFNVRSRPAAVNGAVHLLVHSILFPFTNSCSIITTHMLKFHVN